MRTLSNIETEIVSGGLMSMISSGQQAAQYLYDLNYVRIHSAMNTIRTVANTHAKIIRNAEVGAGADMLYRAGNDGNVSVAGAIGGAIGGALGGALGGEVGALLGAYASGTTTRIMENL